MSAPAQGLYHPSHEHDACGVGFVAHIKGRKSHTIVEQGLTAVTGGTDAGIFELFGKALGERATGPCIGVAPAGLVLQGGMPASLEGCQPPCSAR